MGKFKYGFLKNTDREFPPIMHVETTNICNINCIHCPQADPYKLVPNYKPQQLSFDLWCKIVDEVKNYKVALRLTPDGETLLPLDWVKQVQYALDNKVYLLTFNTNGYFLEGEKLEVLLQPSSTKIAVEISLDALWRSSYEGIRVNSDYVLVYRNILNLVHQIKLRKLKNIKTMVSIVIQPELANEEYEQFLKFWEPIVDKVITRKYVDTKGLTPEKKEVMLEVSERWPCLVPFTRMVISYDGKIRFCPDDWKKETIVGDIREQAIQEIWTGKAMQELRTGHLSGNAHLAHPTCAYCTDWKAIRWGYDYTKALNDLFSEGDHCVTI